MQQHISAYYVLAHTLDPLGGVKNIFYESSHITYQITGNRASSTMQAHILSLQTSLIPGVGVKTYFFTESGHVAYRIKGNKT